MASWLVNKFRENFRGFLHHYRWFIAVFILALLCDAASTIHFMLIEGPEVEIHPIIRFISKALGPVVGPVIAAIGKALAGIVVCVFCRRFAAYIFTAASIISFWAAWYNMWGYKVYTPLILKWIPW